jgi:IS4 transposase
MQSTSNSKKSHSRDHSQWCLSDEIIQVEVDKGSMKTKLKLRKITYYDREHKRTFEFISNLFEFRADTIAALYKLRWQIELLFKQIKQNLLKYF